MSASHYFPSITGHDNLMLALIDLASNDNVKTAAIAGGGTGYTVGDILTVSGGTTVSGYAAELEVTSVAAGVIDGIRVSKCGAYSTQPTNAVSVTGGTGSGATFNLTWKTQNWVVDRNVTAGIVDIDSANLNATREVIMHGVGSAGTDEIYVGWQVSNDSALGNRGAYMWTLFGLTGYNAGATDMTDQPGCSWDTPMRAYVPLTDVAIEAWFYINERWLAGVFKIGSNYMNFFAGFINPYATPSEYPYPMYVSGCSSRYNALPSDSGFSNGGPPDPIAYTNSPGVAYGPGFIRDTAGVWQDVKDWNNSTATAGTNFHPTNSSVNLNSSSDYPDAEDIFIVGSFDFDDVIRSRLYQIEPSSGGIIILVPCVIFNNQIEDGIRFFGELPDFYWLDLASTGLVAEDRVIQNGVYHRIFQNGARTEPQYHYCIREDA